MRDKILLFLAMILLLPADILFLTSKNKKVIICDLSKYYRESPFKKTGIMAFNYCMLFIKPFRNIFYFRSKDSLILRNISRLLVRPLETIEIMGEIGEGFRISHNYAVIHPQYAGKNLFIGHGVTIGKGEAEKNGRIYPIIGDDVKIYSNAVVFGGIIVGNNVKIGAGAVVNKDIPDNCTVVGNPGRIIRKD